MITRDECLEALRGFIARADRSELAEAQAAIIQFAMAQPDAARAEAVDELRRDLTDAVGADLSDPVRQAYHAVIDAMIDRTREAVSAQ